MGEGSETDMLCLSVSSTDYLGHRFGPNSLEIEDTYLRLDKELADFLSFLDKKFGKDNYLVFLTADHGAPQIGAFLKEKKYYTAGSLNSGTLLKNINAICKRKLGIDSAAKKIYDYDVYLNHKTIMSAGISEKKVKETIVEYLKTVKEVWNAFDMEEMNTVPMPDVLRQKLNNSYYFRRSGDIQFFYKAQYTDYTADGLEHGVWYPYDTHIPCVFYGWGIKPGSTNRETSMADIAPTVTALLKIQMPSGCVGKVITEAIK